MEEIVESPEQNLTAAVEVEKVVSAMETAQVEEEPIAASEATADVNKDSIPTEITTDTNTEIAPTPTEHIGDTLSEVNQLKAEVQAIKAEMALLKASSSTFFSTATILTPVPQTTLTSPISSKSINVLLIGNSGSGKSRLINALAMYTRFKNFNEAMDQVVSVKNDFLAEERNETENSGSQLVKSYIFTTTGGQVLRIFDTPGYQTDHINNEALTASIIKQLCFTGISHIDIVLLVAQSGCFSLSPGLNSLHTHMFSHKIFDPQPTVFYVFTHSGEKEHSRVDDIMAVRQYLTESNIITVLRNDQFYYFENDCMDCLHDSVALLSLSFKSWRAYTKSWEQSSIEMQKLFDFIVNEAKS